MLTQEQEKVEIKPGREKLIMDQVSNVRNIARQIHRRLPQHVPVEDLIHAGVLGLIDAVEKYEQARNVKFETYAKFRIRGAILDSLRALDWSPRELRRKARDIESAVQKLSGELRRVPEDQEIADAMGISLSEFQTTVGDLLALEVGTLSVDPEADAFCDDRRLAISTDESHDPYHHCLESELKQLLARSIEQLMEREQQVLSLYYFEELSMREIATILGVVDSRVSQIHTAAILKLRARLKPHAPAPDRLRGRHTC